MKFNQYVAFCGKKDCIRPSMYANEELGFCYEHAKSSKIHDYRIQKKDLIIIPWKIQKETEKDGDLK